MIYYVEDDDNIRELVVYTLAHTGLETKGFSDAAGFYAALGGALPSLVLLDIMLPGENGLSILRKLRADAKWADIPIIMVTAKGTEADTVQGLDLGADDYIAKPFGMAELVARVRARLRRDTPKTDADTLTAGALTLDLKAHTVSFDGEPLALTRKEYELLHLLLERRGEAFSREQLLECVWDYGYDGGTRTIDVHIQTLRAKLGAAGAHIETVRGVGYRFAR